MGRRGPHPRPIEARIADGTYRPDRHGAPLVTSERVALPPEPPPSLRRVKGGIEAWHEIVDPLVDSGILRESDGPAIEAAALALVTMREAQAIIDRDGLLVMGRFDTEVANPAIAVRDRAASEFRAWCQRFGLTPSDRMSLGIQAVKGKSMAEAMAGKIGASPRAGGQPGSGEQGDD